MTNRFLVRLSNIFDTKEKREAALALPSKRRVEKYAACLFSSSPYRRPLYFGKPLKTIRQALKALLLNEGEGERMTRLNRNELRKLRNDIVLGSEMTKDYNNLLINDMSAYAFFDGFIEWLFEKGKDYSEMNEKDQFKYLEEYQEETGGIYIL